MRHCTTDKYITLRATLIDNIRSELVGRPFFHKQLLPEGLPQLSHAVFAFGFVLVAKYKLGDLDQFDDFYGADELDA